MSRIALVLLFALFPLAPATTWGQNPPAGPKPAPEAPKDYRQLVTMPEQALQLMRQDMLSHLTSINLILGHLSEGDLAAASEVAETQLGKSSMGKHRGSGMGPGRFMPLEMRNIGWGMHEAASGFAQVAKKGDVKAAYAALQEVTAACIACHYAYRTR